MQIDVRLRPGAAATADATAMIFSGDRYVKSLDTAWKLGTPR